MSNWYDKYLTIYGKSQFRRILAKYDDRTKGWSMSHWNHLLVLMFGQLMVLITNTNGSNSISGLSGSGENSRMPCAYRFTSTSSPTASLPSSNTTSRLAGQCSRSCVSLASLRSPRTASKTCSSLSMRLPSRMMGNSILTSNLINIY